MKKPHQVVVLDSVMIKPAAYQKWEDQRKAFIANCKLLNITAEQIRASTPKLTIFTDGTAEIRYKVGNNLSVMKIASSDYQLKD